MIEKVLHKKILFALIVRAKFRKMSGINFFTDNNATQQFGYMKHAKNYLIKPYKFFLDANSSKLINNLITQVSVFTDQALETLMTIGTELFILI